MLFRARSLSLFLLLLALQTLVARALEPGRKVDVLQYSLDLTPYLANKTVRGDEWILLRSTAPDLRRIAFTANALTIDEASLDGTPLRHAVENGQLLFDLPQALRSGRTARLHLVYHGAPQDGIVFAPDSVYTSYDACSWMICAEDEPGDKARFALDLHRPAGTRSLASGRLVGQTRSAEGGFIDHWRLRRPYSAYLFDFAIGKFTVVDRRQPHARMLYLSSVETRPQLLQSLEKTGDMVRFLSSRAGLALPGGSYAQLIVDGDEAQEASNYSILGRENLDPRDDWAIVHELAHQWWGNLVTCATWKDFWLNEGIVVYMTAAWKEHAYGREAYQVEMDRARSNVAALRKKGWDRPLAFGGSYPDIGTRRAVQYSKGALFMEALRNQLGDRAFWAGLRLYTRANAGGTVTSIDLERAMEKASGRDLSALFAEWVFDRPAEAVR